MVDHIDNNKKNNRIDNLQLLTQKENLNKCRCKNKTKEIQINVTIVNICISGSKRKELYLTVILRGRAGYEMIYITNEAVGRVGYYQLISGKSEKNNSFSKFSSSPITGNCHSTHLFPLHKTYSENIT